MYMPHGRLPPPEPTGSPSARAPSSRTARRFTLRRPTPLWWAKFRRIFSSRGIGHKTLRTPPNQLPLSRSIRKAVSRRIGMPPRMSAHQREIMARVIPARSIRWSSPRIKIRRVWKPPRLSLNLQRMQRPTPRLQWAMPPRPMRPPRHRNKPVRMQVHRTTRLTGQMPRMLPRRPSGVRVLAVQGLRAIPRRLRVLAAGLIPEPNPRSAFRPRLSLRIPCSHEAPKARQIFPALCRW